MNQDKYSGLEINEAQEARLTRVLMSKGLHVQKAFNNVGKAVEGESFEDWMKRAGTEYKKIMAELRESGKRAMTERKANNEEVRKRARGHYNENGKKYYEWEQGGILYNKEILEDWDQYKG